MRITFTQTGHHQGAGGAVGIEHHRYLARRRGAPPQINDHLLASGEVSAAKVRMEIA